MASKGLQSRRFVQLIHQQLEILKQEGITVKGLVDDCINQVQSEVDAWVNGGLVNRTTYCEMNNRIHELIQLLIEKSVELSGQQIEEQKSDFNHHSLPTMNNSTSTGVSYTNGEVEGSSTSHFLLTKFTILEEAVCSIKNTIGQVQEKQDHFDELFLEFSSKHDADDRILQDLSAKHEIVDRALQDFSSKNKNFDKLLKDITTRQEHVCENIEILTNTNLNSRKKLQNRLSKLEKGSEDIFSNFDELFETVENFDVKLNRLEDENKSVNVSMNELNKQISSVRTCSNDALMSKQDLSKSVESTNQHYNEMSNKMDQLEISIDLMSSQYMEQFRNMGSLNEDKVDDLIGMVCQLLSKRLFPLEKLNESLNKKVILSKEHISKKKAIDTALSGTSCKVSQLESKLNQTSVGFHACKIFDLSLRCSNIDKYTNVSTNYGSHFNPSSGEFTAPLHGLYLISIYMIGIENKIIISPFNIKCKIKCIQKLKIPQFIFGYTRELCSVSDNECVTYLVELKAGDELFVQFETKEEDLGGSIWIQFSCFMMK